MTLTTPFSLDRDLLAACPTLLRDAVPAGRVLHEEASAAIANGRITVSVPVDSTGVGVGSVMTASSKPYEVTGTYGTYQYNLTSPLAKPEDTLRPPDNATGVSCVFLDFRTYRVQASEDVCRRLGLGVDPTDADALLPSVANPSLLKRLEVLRTLELIFSTSRSDAEAALNNHYTGFFRGRYEELLHHSAVELDLDGDGVPERERRFDVLAVARR
ncbi:MAG: hypothetical protein AAF328_11360 [Planctomycetota bacterium]